MNRLVITAVLLAAGCGRTYHARLDDGAGLAEGTPVVVSSVRVGEVESVRVVEGHVDVELAIDREHEVTVRADGCALARRTESGAELVLVPGTGAPLADGATIPQCEARAGDIGSMIRALGEGMNEALRELGRSLNGPGGSDSAPPPAP